MSKIINYVADSTKEKIGKYTPGTHIPIVSINLTPLLTLMSPIKHHI